VSGAGAVVAPWLGAPSAAQTSTLTLATPSPSPSPGELDPNDVSPGLLGFVVMFAVVLACIPLFRSMTSKIRGVEHRPEPGGEPGTGTPADRTPGTR